MRILRLSVREGTHVDKNAQHTVFLLAICQALTETGNIIIGVTSALTGYMLAADKALATVPVALVFTFVMLSTFPASLFMRLVGRRIGFTTGQLIGVFAAATSIFAIYQNDFWLFAVGGALFGIHGAFFQYYRFAAADVAGERYRSRAISFVLAGGIIGAIFGPELAKVSRDLFQPVLFAGNFMVILILCLITIIILQFIRIPGLSLVQKKDTGRPLLAIARQPTFIVALISGMFGFGSMTLIMTATPLAVTSHDHTFADVAFVIQWHVLGMFAPSFVTGHLIHRFGTLNIILVGAILIMTCIGINLWGIRLSNFWVALLALGVGWNFMFVGGTTLLTTTYETEERAKVQGVNDFCIFATVAGAAFLSGILHNQLGWQAVNLGVVIPIITAFSAAFWLRIRSHSSISLIKPS